MDYQYRGFKVDGRFIGPSGKLIRDGTVEAMGGDSPESLYGISVSVSLKRGRYVLFLPKGTYWFTASPHPSHYPGRSPHAITIASDTTIDFAASGHVVEGRAILGKFPWANAEIEARGVSWPDTQETFARGTVASNGTFLLYLPDGFYHFWVGMRPDRELPPFVPRFFQREIRGPVHMNLAFSATRWAGTVHDSLTGALLDSVRVLAVDTEHQITAMSVSGRKGRFRLVLESGRPYTLFWSVGGRVPHKVGSAIAKSDSTFDLRVSR